VARFDLGRIGEDGLVRLLRTRAGSPGPRWSVGIGDDAAVLRPRAGQEIVITTDALMEGVHFRWRTTDPRSLGHKALAVNLSDVAAMGAVPLGFVLSAGLPPRTSAKRLSGFVAGLLAESRSASCPLVGGDSVRAETWSLALTVFGEVPRGRALLRSGARPGDRVFVTGTLGGSALGLAVLERGAGRRRGAKAFVSRQRRPRPPLSVGPGLLRRGWATAAMDLSDGLARDLGRLLAASGVGADIDAQSLPLPRGARALCAGLDLDPHALALHGGEDYELLFCAPPGAPTAARMSRALGSRVSEIGRIRRGRGLDVGGQRAGSAGGIGWSHFKASAGSSDK